VNINNPTTFSAPALVFSTSNSSGTSGALRANDTLAIFSTTVPTNVSTSTVSASTGDNAFGSREDHVHGSTAVIVAASEAEQVTGTATGVFTTPGRQDFHPSAAKVWVRITDAGAIESPDYGTASVTDVGTGNYTIVFDEDFATTVYIPVQSTSYSAAVAIGWGVYAQGSYNFQTTNIAMSNLDVRTQSAFFGVLA